MIKCSGLQGLNIQNETVYKQNGFNTNCLEKPTNILALQSIYTAQCYITCAMSSMFINRPNVAGVSRAPSPRELAAHTQSLMQNAIIKKKLEEQRENFRRRQEMQPPKQSTPISFTPTSVSHTLTVTFKNSPMPILFMRRY